MKLILWWSFASLLQVSDQQSKVCFGIPQQQKTLQTMLLFAACMPGLSGHDWCSFFMFLYDTVSLCYNSNSLGKMVESQTMLLSNSCKKDNKLSTKLAKCYYNNFTLRTCGLNKKEVHNTAFNKP